MIETDPRRVYNVQVVSITDGDDLVVRVDEPNWPEVDDTRLRVRLWGIDAPEWNQPYGRDAQAELERLCSGSEVFGLQVVERDAYRRYVGILRLHPGNVATSKGDTVNRRMVASGLAYWYRHYAEGETIGLRTAEADAKRARRGVWSDQEGGVRPWVLRAQRAAADEPERLDLPARTAHPQSAASIGADTEMLEKLREIELHLQKLQETDVLLIEWLQERDHMDRQADFRKLREELQSQHLWALQQAREQLQRQHVAALEDLSSALHRDYRAEIEELRTQLIEQSDVRLAHADLRQPPPLSLWGKLRRALFAKRSPPPAPPR